MKIAVLGGSFNPFHIGHALLAETVIKQLHYDKVLLVPSFLSPHKFNTKIKVTPIQRLEMIQKFCQNEGKDFCIAEDCEILREGISYTYETLEYLTKKFQKELKDSNSKLAFIMGSEVAAEFSKWKNPQRIAELADLIITHRYPEVNTIENTMYKNAPSGTYKGDFNQPFNQKAFGFDCIYLENPLLPVSSTKIRACIKENLAFKYLLPNSIYEYIVENNLYND